MYKRYLEPSLRVNPTNYITKKLKVKHDVMPNDTKNCPIPESECEQIHEKWEMENDVEMEIEAEGQQKRKNEHVQERECEQNHEKWEIENDVETEIEVAGQQKRKNEHVEKPANQELDDFFSSINDELVHPNLKCQTADAIILILEFFLHHKLTWVAFEQLLKLFHAVLGDDSRLPNTKYFFKKILGTQDQAAVFHFYCKNCNIYINTFENIKTMKSMECSNCQQEFSLDKMNDGCFFIQIPLRKQLCDKIIDNPEILSYDTTADTNGCIRDIFDGDLYKDLRLKVGHENGKLLTLTMNTDGVKVFKSKGKSSLWPIQIILNECPTQKRFKRENIILTGIWFGKNVDMALYLKPLADDLNDLEDDKIKVIQNGKSFDITVRGIFMTTDTMARCKVLAMKQFNGMYGCTYCLHPGNVTSDPKHRKYHVSVNDYRCRTHSCTLKLMEQFAMEGEADFGVKGISPLLAIKDYDLIRGTVIDYMHCVLLGVVLLLLNLWFDSHNHFENYYITPRGTQVVNNNLKCIKTLRSFSRRPRVIDDKAYWKANELRNWILYFAIPCLKGTLKDVYLQHFTLLSEAIFTFLKTSIPINEFNKASKNLDVFVAQFQSLYGEENMVYNVHLLKHLAKCVKDCGPLWTYSNFNFESNNGVLVKFVNGTTNVEKQIATKYNYNNTLNGFKKKRNTASDYIDRIRSNRVKYSKKIGDITLLGKSKRAKLLAHEEKVLNCKEILDYKKFFFLHDVFYSTSYTRAKTTNDTVVCLKDGGYGIITRIYESNKTVYILIRKMIIEKENFLPMQIRKVLINSKNYQSVPVSDIVEKCILVSTKNGNYVSKLPNRIESD